MSTLRPLAALLLAVSFAVVAPAPAAAAVYKFNAYTASGSGGTFVNQPDSCTCVAASAQAWINKINRTQNQSAATVWSRFAWARPYTQYICRLYDASGKVTSAGVPTSTYGKYNASAAGYTRYKYSNRNPGLDPRAFAWILYWFTPPGYHFNDYWLNAGNDGSQAQAQRDSDTSLVKNLRITGRPAGAIIHGGTHAVLVTGFQSDYDPLVHDYSILGFYVWDPYSNVLGHDYGTGYLGQTFFTIADWKANQFTPYHDPQYTKDSGGKYAIWEKDPRSGGPSYVAVFQTSNLSTTVEGPPTDSPPNSIGYVRWTGHTPVKGGAGVSPAAAVDAASSGLPVGRGELVAERTLAAQPGASLETAVRDGLAQTGLAGASALGDLTGARVGERLRVRSTGPAAPSYWLVTLERAGKAVAVATVNEDADGLRLGSVTGTSGDYRLPQPARAKTALAATGHTVRSIEAVYAGGSASQLAPAWSAVDTNGRRWRLAGSGLPVEEK